MSNEERKIKPVQFTLNVEGKVEFHCTDFMLFHSWEGSSAERLNKARREMFTRIEEFQDHPGIAFATLYNEGKIELADVFLLAAEALVK